MANFKFLLLYVFLNFCDAKRILFLQPVSNPSHHNIIEPIIKGLGLKGHEVISMSSIISPDMPPTVKQIQLFPWSFIEHMDGMPEPIAERKRIKTEGSSFNMFSLDFLNKQCEMAYESEKMQKFIREEKPFDLVFIDIYTNYCYLGLIPHFKAKSWIYISTVAAPTWITELVGNRLPPSYIPSNMIPYSDSMSLSERFVNTIMESFLMKWVWQKMIISPGEAIYRKYLPNGDKLPGVDEIGRNVSMIFMNSHFALTYPRPLLPNVIEIGGIHTREGRKLPKDLQDYLDSSGKDGFILFSLGSVLKGSKMDDSMRKKFLNVFGRLKQKVLWKWESETMDGLPANVKLSKWLPQQDILAHNNCKLFMSHGGLLSTQESVYHAVPVLGIPVFADQDLNVAQAEKRGYAKSIEITSFTEEELESTILELINKPIYKQNVADFSKRVKDLPEPPVDKAVYWAEYLLRHDGAPHLRSGARDLNFFQYYLLDIAAILICTVIIFGIVLVWSCKKFVGMICGRGNHLKVD